MPVLSELLYRRNQRGISTGFPDLNVELSGSRDGLQIPSIVEISGPPGCGKSAIVLRLLLDASRAGRRCLWVNAGYRPIPTDRLRELPHYDARLENYIDVIDVFDLAEASMLPQIARAYEVVLMPSYHDVFPPPPQKPAFQRHFSESPIDEQRILKLRRARRTAMFSILSQMAQTCCVVMTSNMVAIPDQFNSKLRLLDPPLNFKPFRSLMLYRDQDGKVFTDQGSHIDVSSGDLDVKSERRHRIDVERLPSSCNDEQVLSSQMAKQYGSRSSLGPMSPPPPVRLTFMNSDPPDVGDNAEPANEADAGSGIVMNSQVEYSDFPIEHPVKRVKTQPATGGWLA